MWSVIVCFRRGHSVPDQEKNINKITINSKMWEQISSYYFTIQLKSSMWWRCIKGLSKGINTKLANNAESIAHLGPSIATNVYFGRCHLFLDRFSVTSYQKLGHKAAGLRRLFFISMFNYRQVFTVVEHHKNQFVIYLWLLYNLCPVIGNRNPNDMTLRLNLYFNNRFFPLETLCSSHVH